MALVLADIGDASSAVDLLANARQIADRKCSRLVRSWLAAAHGEILATEGRHYDGLCAFDRADALLSENSAKTNAPYVALDSVLARWRGYVLARSGAPDAIDVLTGALKDLDSTFIRAETSLRVDLVVAHAALGNHREACAEHGRAERLVAQIGSVRQRRRLSTFQG